MVGYASDGVPIVVGPEWDDPEYGDEARERNPVYREVHRLPPLGDDAPAEAAPPARRQPLTLRLDPDLLAFYRTEAERSGARSAQALMGHVLRAWMLDRQTRISPDQTKRAAE